MSVNRVFRVEVACEQTGEVKGVYMVSSEITTQQDALERAIHQFGEQRVVSVSKQ